VVGAGTEAFFQGQRQGFIERLIFRPQLQETSRPPTLSFFLPLLSLPTDSVPLLRKRSSLVLPVQTRAMKTTANRPSSNRYDDGLELNREQEGLQYKEPNQYDEASAYERLSAHQPAARPASSESLRNKADCMEACANLNGFVPTWNYTTNVLRSLSASRWAWSGMIMVPTAG